MFHFDKHLASRNMRIGEDVRSGVDRAERNASVKRVCDLCLGADARPSLDEVDRLLGVGQPIIVGRNLGSLDRSGRPMMPTSSCQKESRGQPIVT